MLILLPKLKIFRYLTSHLITNKVLSVEVCVFWQFSHGKSVELLSGIFIRMVIFSVSLSRPCRFARSIIITAVKWPSTTLATSRTTMWRIPEAERIHGGSNKSRIIRKIDVVGQIQDWSLPHCISEDLKWKAVSWHILHLTEHLQRPWKSHRFEGR